MKRQIYTLVSAIITLGAISFNAVALDEGWPSNNPPADVESSLGCLAHEYVDAKVEDAQGIIARAKKECEEEAKKLGETVPVLAYRLRVNGSKHCNAGRDYEATCLIKYK